VDNFDFTTNVTAVISCFNNIGPGLNVVGPMGNFGGFSIFSKLVLSLDMLFGRLEILPMLVLFSARSWAKKN
jgi:trk system potassium uptake protein TrkH